MKNFFKNIDNRWKEYALAGCVCIVFLILILNLGGIFKCVAAFFRIIKPIIIGFVLAYIINPIAVFFKTKILGKMKNETKQWIISVIIATIIAIALVSLLIVSLIPQIIDNVETLADNYEAYVNSFVRFLTEKGGVLGKSFVDRVINFANAEGGLIAKIGDILQDNVDIVFEKTTSIGNAAMNGAIGGIFAIYFLLAKNKIQKGLERLLRLLLSPLNYEYTNMLAKKFNVIFTEYIVCEILDAVIVGVATYFFMLFTNMPDALFIAVVCGITNLIPTFGPIIGGVIGGFILLLLKPSTVLAFVIWVVIIQFLDGYVLKPKLFGDALNVPGVVILVSIIVFGKIMGVTGMLLAIPIAAILVYIYSELFIPWLELKKELKQYEQDIK